MAVGIGEGRPDVRLVRRLVLAEADVSVDAERGPGRVGPERDPARPERLVERDAQRLERVLEESLVVGLSRLEPGALVVLGQVGEELDRLAPEALEQPGASSPWRSSWSVGGVRGGRARSYIAARSVLVGGRCRRRHGDRREGTMVWDDGAMDDPFDYDHFLALPRLSGLRLAPDGRWLAVAVATPAPDGTSFRTAIWAIDPDGASRTPSPDALGRGRERCRLPARRFARLHLVPARPGRDRRCRRRRQGSPGRDLAAAGRRRRGRAAPRAAGRHQRDPGRGRRGDHRLHGRAPSGHRRFRGGCRAREGAQGRRCLGAPVRVVPDPLLGPLPRAARPARLRGRPARHDRRPARRAGRPDRVKRDGPARAKLRHRPRRPVGRHDLAPRGRGCGRRGPRRPRPGDRGATPADRRPRLVGRPGGLARRPVDRGGAGR